MQPSFSVLLRKAGYQQRKVSADRDFNLKLIKKSTIWTVAIMLANLLIGKENPPTRDSQVRWGTSCWLCAGGIVMVAYVTPTITSTMTVEKLKASHISGGTDLPGEATIAQ
jgi:hypothetical protein